MSRNSRDTHTHTDINRERIIILILMMISHVYYLLHSRSLFLSISSPNTTGVYILVEKSYFGMSPSLVPLLKYEFTFFRSFKRVLFRFRDRRVTHQK
jgi:hypothetical protein